jgi:hypothetical protein
MDGGRMTVGPKHRVRSWCMLAAIVAVLIVLIALGIYTVSNQLGAAPGPQTIPDRS